MTTNVSINGARLYDSLSALGAIGAYTDARTGLQGVSRLALTAADAEGRNHVVALMRAAGLAVTIDRIGNVFARRRGRTDSLAPVMMGSHIDSVQTAGRFDGCLGVLGALEVVRTLNDHAIETERPVVVAFFTDEEGCRFGTDMLGSAVATGRIPLETAHALRDRDGKDVRGELEKTGYLGTESEKLTPPHAYLECHVEQGPLLRKRDQDIGIVEGVQSISWHEVTIVGRSAHAGTTPMDLRADAGLVAARINLKLREMARSGTFGAGMRTTMGVVLPRPGLVNVIPGEVVCTVDLRNPDDAQMRRAEAEIIAFYAEAAAAEGVTVTWRQTARTETVTFSSRVRESVAEAARARGLRAERIVSGAGHDAQEMAHICDAGMVFVPGEFDGISHNPRELSTKEQCENGINVLFDVLLKFANEK